MFRFLCSLAIASTFYACKKESSQPKSSPTTNKETVFNPNGLARLSSGTSISVDARGYLSFESVDEVQSFITSLTEGTHAEAKAFFNSRGFSPKALGMFDESFDNHTISKNQASYYLISAVNTIQIDGVVMKLTDNNSTVLTLTGNNITDVYYQQLASGNFNSSAMNRFATNTISEEQQYDFISFNKQSPTGFDNSGTTTPTPTPSGIRFGWFHNVDVNDVYNTFHEYDAWYFFGIKIITRDHYYGSTIP